MQNKYNQLSSRMFHCFGTRKGEKVTAKLASEMISASGIEQIPINTHCIDNIDDWRDLPIGYGDATWNTVSDYIDMNNRSPIWNINLTNTSKEEVCRTKKVLQLCGLFPVKLEVLNSDTTWSNNLEVLKAVKELIHVEGITIWPLIAPSLSDYKELVKLNCPLIRIMGSPISSNKGIDPQYLDDIAEILSCRDALVMLDGGVNSLETIALAFELGFDHVLINSWLFTDGGTPVKRLTQIKSFCDTYNNG